MLVRITEAYTGLDQVHGMQVGSAGNGGGCYFGRERGCRDWVFCRVDGGRGLDEIARNWGVPSRSSFVWLYM